MPAIRLFGIYAPEMPSYCRRGRRGVAGDPVTSGVAVIVRGLATIERRGCDHYGRTLARVRLNGVDVSDHILNSGTAQPYRWETEMGLRPQPERRAADPINRAALVRVVDSVPETRGMGVLLRHRGRIEKLRAAGGSGGSILFELRERQINPAYFQRLRPGRVPSLTAGQRQAGWSVMRQGSQPLAGVWPGGLPSRPTMPAPVSRIPNRNASSVPPSEWRSLGLNCAGAVVGWIGVVGTGALAPFTGGLTFGATIVLYAGALAGSGQCMASVYRVNNARRGRSDINETLDKSPVYIWSMRGADAIGLVGAAGGLVGVAKTGAALSKTGVKAGDLAARSLTRAARAELSAAMGINGVKLGTRMINKVVRQRLLDGAGGVLGVVSSADGGLIRELIVWVIADKEKGNA
ncbi:thermonuclease family protein [Sphingomonas sp. Leaf9]|uniref:thermonuclease family protein n=1 Tax=Sphingomonas sp. Leaf9 TaxID=1735674 RepID=UPI0012E19E7A|nr:hypothetical protein [Sphingomonas sp. Leaf9]